MLLFMIIILPSFFLVTIHSSQKKVREVPPYREPPGPASPPLRTLPPYRDPPPPNLNSPGRSQFVHSGSSHVHKDDQPSSSNSIKLKRNLIQVLTMIIFDGIIYIRLHYTFVIYNFYRNSKIQKYLHNLLIHFLRQHKI